ncbi:ABC transporter ATP-binding protein [Bradyrhizobium canariense]|uniref:Amino acid/amide ABC transporter ATP-binding protein 1, HAAT family n=1 Tax=Bradyrhizobium canariense TaxID=255045 RepID=A0A1H1SJ25_9BRAD|nr:ABC transporter ATP-binding protein [Bradyrhizobium canariense]SDS47746.1 amino acid/amide ABC transporter ATP-binding protein 1, HAAT family [Bradyrhizobium canariense]
MALLSVRDLTQRFSGLTALDDVSFDVEEGAIVGLIGPNGAGKTTMINLITGICRPTSGDILFGGKSLVGRKPHQIARDGIGRTFQQIRLFDQLSVVENVMVGMDSHLRTSYGAAVLDLPSVAREEAKMRADALTLLAEGRGGLEAFSERRAGELPYADKRRLEIVRALATRPRLLLLDEPAAGMALQEIRNLVHDLLRIRSKGTTIILIEHKMRLIEGVTDKVIVLDYGRKIAEGSFDEIRRDARVIEAYLGRGYANAGAEEN